MSKKIKDKVLSMVATAAIFALVISGGLPSMFGMYQPKLPAGLDEHKLKQLMLRN